MPSYKGVPGVGATLLVDGAKVDRFNPLPVIPGGGFGPGVAVGPQLETTLTALVAGNNLISAAAVGKIIFVTGYNFSLPVADTTSFRSGAATIISAQGIGVVGGNEAAGSEGYLFKTGIGAALNFNVGLAAAVAGVQVRFRIQA